MAYLLYFDELLASFVWKNARRFLSPVTCISFGGKLVRIAAKEASRPRETTILKGRLKRYADPEIDA